MAKKQYSYYPGCSSVKLGSAANMDVSVKSMCDVLDIQLNEISDWNCCSASIGYGDGGELPRMALSARNLALSAQENPGQDMVATCAACWLATRETKDRLEQDREMMDDMKQALSAGGLQLEEAPEARHMCEVIVEDFGFDALAEKVVRPLEGLKVAGYVGCQTNRPFGIDGESFENPVYLDKMIESCGADAIAHYDQKVSCCGGALMFSEPEKCQPLVKDIVEAAYDNGADMIATPCPVCQMNVEVYQGQINKKFGTKFNIPVVYYSQLLSVAFGKNSKQSGLDGQVIKAPQLEKIAGK